MAEDPSHSRSQLDDLDLLHHIVEKRLHDGADDGGDDDDAGASCAHHDPMVSTKGHYANEKKAILKNAQPAESQIAGVRFVKTKKRDTQYNRKELVKSYTEESAAENHQKGCENHNVDEDDDLDLLQVVAGRILQGEPQSTTKKAAAAGGVDLEEGKHPITDGKPSTSFSSSESLLNLNADLTSLSRQQNYHHQHPIQPGAYNRTPGEGESRRNDALRYSGLNRDQDASSRIVQQQQQGYHQEDQLNNNDDDDEGSAASAAAPRLSVATLVTTGGDGEDLPVAQRVNDNHLRNNQQRAQQKSESLISPEARNCLSISSILFVVVGIVVILIVVLDSSSSDSVMKGEEKDHVAIAATTTTTTSPSSFLEYPMTLFPVETVNSILGSTTRNDNDNGNSTTMMTPQAQAYQWLVNDPSLQTYPEWRIRQRFALSTMFYSVGGNNWFQNGTTASSTSTTRGPVAESQSLDPPTHHHHHQQQQQQQYEWLRYDVHECSWYNKNWESRGREGSKNACNDLDEYIHLKMPGNNLDGTLPPELALLTSLESLALHRNKLRGTIPLELFRGWTSITEIMLAMNQLSGTLPSQVGLWSNNIQQLSFQFNSLTGPFPSELWQLSRLELLHMQKNDWSDCLPSEIGNLDRLGSLEFRNNCVNRSLPTEIGKATSLFRLQFSSQFGWTLPSQIGQLPNLSYLLLHKANLMGSIPTSFGRLTKLVALGLDHNPQLLGSIPPSMGSLVPSPAAVSTNHTPFCPDKKPWFHPWPPPQEEYLDLEVVFFRDTGLTGTIPSEWCHSLEMLCFDCSNASKICGCDCPCLTT